MNNNEQINYEKAIHNIIDEFFVAGEEKYISELEESICKILRKGLEAKDKEKKEIIESAPLERDSNMPCCGDPSMSTGDYGITDEAEQWKQDQLNKLNGNTNRA